MDKYDTIKSESTILAQLLNRNYNQHRKSQIYNSLKQISKLTISIDSKSVKNVLNTCDQVLESLHKKNISKAQLISSFLCMKQLQHILTQSFELEYWLSKSWRILFDAISKGIFVPLYTVFLSIVSSLNTINSKSIIYLRKLYLTFTVQIQNIRILHPSYHTEIESYINTTFESYLQSDSCIQKINELCTVYQPEDIVPLSSSSATINAINTTTTTTTISSADEISTYVSKNILSKLSPNTSSKRHVKNKDITNDAMKIQMDNEDMGEIIHVSASLTSGSSIDANASISDNVMTHSDDISSTNINSENTPYMDEEDVKICINANTNVNISSPTPSVSNISTTTKHIQSHIKKRKSQSHHMSNSQKLFKKNSFSIYNDQISSSSSSLSLSTTTMVISHEKDDIDAIFDSVFS